jgi:ankyrin repeat protein
VPTEERAIEAIQLLLDRRVDIRASNDGGDTALHGAVSRGDLVVRFVAEHGADLLATNKAGHTALDLALGAGARPGAVPMPRETAAALLRQLIDARH